jgi:D-alanyl-lipoteichoic acid acyltransferase DltB (MBOAT superfamily)
LACNLGLLGFFKYFNFFVDSLQGALALWNIDATSWRLEIILPVGISFYTFQTMSYTIDIYRKKLKHTDCFLDFALFVSFFPQLVAGPIERASHLLPQITQKRTITRSMLKLGFTLILWGYFKKMVVADNMAVLANQIFNMDPSRLNIWTTTLGGLAFTFQIYGDFAGYSDIARGLCKIMGFDLMVNFRSPFFVKNISDFWHHWHISLSTWLRDYLYIPLGGNRGSKMRTRTNLMITMALGGLWHGAQWNFVIWGVYQGILLMLFPNKQTRNPVEGKLKSFGKWLVTSFFVLIGWIIFRCSDSASQCLAVLSSLPRVGALTHAILLQFAGIVFFGWLICWEQLNKLTHHHEVAFVDAKPLFKLAIYAYMIFAILFLSAQSQQQFIYFQF